MSVFTGSPYVMAETTLTNDHPIIGYRQGYVTTSNVTSNNGSNSLFPVSNLANPSTYLKWKSPAAFTADQINVTFNPALLIDYVGIVGHNFPVGATVSVTYTTTNSPSDLIALVSGVVTGPGPIILRFTPVTAGAIQILVTESNSPGTVIKEIAAIYVGKLLVIERKIYANHAPLPQARTWKATNGMTESGQFLGRIVLEEYRRNKVPLQLLTPAWYRANFDAFLATADEFPFFFAWRPNTYPNEVGYAWLASIPLPVPTPPSNLISIDLELSGIT